MDADRVEAPDGDTEGSKIETEGAISRGMNAPKGTPTGILRVDSGKARRTSLDIKLLSQHEPASPQPSVDRLSVTFADDSQRSDRTESSQKTMDKVHFPTGNTDEENSDDEDYSASVTAIMQRRASTRRSKKRSGRRGSSPFSPDILPDNESGRRRSSVFTTSSGDTAITMEDSFTPSVTQDQIFENIKLHKEVLGSVKMQPWNMRKKLRLVMQAKEYIKKHEGALQERLAQSHSTRDILARCNIFLIKKWQHFKREAANLSNWLIPWEKRIKEIESHFGSVVASYFIFLRWLFWVNMVISIVLVAFVAVPEMLMADFKKDPERKTILPEDRYNSTNFLTLWDFEGVFKYSPMFYGWYTNLDLVDKAYRLPLAYFFTGLAVYVYSFVATLRKMAKNSRMSKLSEKEDECIFSWKLFTGWDYMIGNAETAHNRVASIVMSFKEALLEEAEKKRESKSWKLIGSRILVNTGVLGLLFLSAFAVVTVVARSNEKEANSTTWRRNEITVVMSLISLFFPILFELLGYFEHYHPRKQLRLQLARIMVLNLLNLYSLIFALFGKISNMTHELQALKPPNATSLLPQDLTTKFPLISPQPTEIASFNNCYTICEQNGLEIANLISETFHNLNPTPNPQTIQRAISATLNNLTQSVTPTPVDLSNVFKFDISGLKNKLQEFLNDITDEGKWDYMETTTLSTPTTTEEISTTLKNKCRQQCEALNETLKLPVIQLTDYQKRSKLRSLCWETMFGQELVKLTVMDLVMTVLSSLAIDFLRGLFVRYVNNFWCWDLEKTFPQYGDFKVAENILHLVNNQGMVWMGMFFSPGLVVLNVIKLYIMMYLRSWAVLACNVPHEIIFRASRSNNFYFALLLMMLFLCVLPVGFTIVWLEPSWHCGPFSKYHRIFHIFTKTIRKALPEPFHKILDYTASPGIVIPLLMLLVLIIYYLISLTNALREANNDLKIQLRRERTEERRKMFQIADRRTRSGSGESGDLNQFGKWKKLLQGMPGNKSFDETPKEISEIEDQQQLAAKKVLSRFIFRSIKNRKPSINQSDEDSVMPQDDGTDTDQHESLPDDASFRLKPGKRNSLENGERKPYKPTARDSTDSEKLNLRLKPVNLDSLDIGEKGLRRTDANNKNEKNKQKYKTSDSNDSEENKRKKRSNGSEDRKKHSLDSDGRKTQDSLDSKGNRKKSQLKKMDSLEPVLPKHKHKHKKKLDSLDSAELKLKTSNRKLRKFDSFIRSSTESGDKHASIKEPSSKKKENVHRVDSISSNWSENIPVITISKTESTECILETLGDLEVEIDTKEKHVCEVEAVGGSRSRAMKLLRSKFGGEAKSKSVIRDSKDGNDGEQTSFFKSIIRDKSSSKVKNEPEDKLGNELRKSGENSGSLFTSMVRDKSKEAELSKQQEKLQKSEAKNLKKADSLARAHKVRPVLKKQASEVQGREIGQLDSVEVKNDSVVKSSETGSSGRASRFFLYFFKSGSSDKSKSIKKSEEESSNLTKITEETLKKENVEDKLKQHDQNKIKSDKKFEEEKLEKRVEAKNKIKSDENVDSNNKIKSDKKIKEINVEKHIDDKSKIRSDEKFEGVAKLAREIKNTSEESANNTKLERQDQNEVTNGKMLQEGNLNGKSNTTTENLADNAKHIQENVEESAVKVKLEQDPYDKNKNKSNDNLKESAEKVKLDQKNISDKNKIKSEENLEELTDNVKLGLEIKVEENVEEPDTLKLGQYVSYQQHGSEKKEDKLKLKNNSGDSNKNNKFGENEESLNHKLNKNSDDETNKNSRTPQEVSRKLESGKTFDKINATETYDKLEQLKPITSISKENIKEGKFVPEETPSKEIEEEDVNKPGNKSIGDLEGAQKEEKRRSCPNESDEGSKLMNLEDKYENPESVSKLLDKSVNSEEVQHGKIFRIHPKEAKMKAESKPVNPEGNQPKYSSMGSSNNSENKQQEISTEKQDADLEKNQREQRNSKLNQEQDVKENKQQDISAEKQEADLENNQQEQRNSKLNQEQDLKNQEGQGDTKKYHDADTRKNLQQQENSKHHQKTESKDNQQDQEKSKNNQEADSAKNQKSQGYSKENWGADSKKNQQQENNSKEDQEANLGKNLGQKVNLETVSVKKQQQEGFEKKQETDSEKIQKGQGNTKENPESYSKKNEQQQENQDAVSEKNQQQQEQEEVSEKNQQEKVQQRKKYERFPTISKGKSIYEPISFEENLETEGLQTSKIESKNKSGSREIDPKENLQEKSFCGSPEGSKVKPEEKQIYLEENQQDGEIKISIEGLKKEVEQSITEATNDPPPMKEQCTDKNAPQNSSVIQATQIDEGISSERDYANKITIQKLQLSNIHESSTNPLQQITFKEDLSDRKSSKSSTLSPQRIYLSENVSDVRSLKDSKLSPQRISLRENVSDSRPLQDSAILPQRISLKESITDGRLSKDSIISPQPISLKEVTSDSRSSNDSTLPLQKIYLKEGPADGSSSKGSTISPLKEGISDDKFSKESAEGIIEKRLVTSSENIDPSVMLKKTNLYLPILQEKTKEAKSENIDSTKGAISKIFDSSAELEKTKGATTSKLLDPSLLLKNSKEIKEENLDSTFVVENIKETLDSSLVSEKTIGTTSKILDSSVALTNTPISENIASSVVLEKTKEDTSKNVALEKTTPTSVHPDASLLDKTNEATSKTLDSPILQEETKEPTKTKQSFFSKLRKRKDDKAKKGKKEKGGNDKPKKQDKATKTTIEDKEDLDEIISPITKRISFKFPALSKSKPEPGFNTNVFLENVSDQAVGTLKSLERYTPVALINEEDSLKKEENHDNEDLATKMEIASASLLSANVVHKCEEELNRNIRMDKASDEKNITDVTRKYDEAVGTLKNEELDPPMKKVHTSCKEDSESEIQKSMGFSDRSGLVLKLKERTEFSEGVKLPDSKPVIVFEHYKYPGKSSEMGTAPTSAEMGYVSGILTKKSLGSSSSLNPTIQSLKPARSAFIETSTKSTVLEPKLTDINKPAKEIETSLKLPDIQKPTKLTDQVKGAEGPITLAGIEKSKKLLHDIENTTKSVERDATEKGLELFSESSEDDNKNSSSNSELKKADSKSSSSDESGKFDTVKRRKLLKDLKPEQNETESSTEYKDDTISN